MTEGDYRRFEAALEEWCEEHPIRVEIARASAWIGGPLAGIIITDFYADEPGNGVGTETMQMIVSMAEENSIALYLTPESPRAKGFFEKHGFEHCMRFGQYMHWLPPVPAGALA